ncbi:hypothetical protein B0T11DRAFT_284652 [Plectosphaerella cucumerina]|uniref:Uncharacterized protein n=1 Tax=Plectosphaerella cucumerina TaxID=40658 RepID=A0A8K0X1S6_9PEZI|nr:hypothetical protein B0T11DRAFT_284652 [Plectosphaerella cucumerina]
MLATLGPLLQRAVSVELVGRTDSLDMTLPIRREPMWNLTSRLHEGYYWVSPMAYYDEFARASRGLNQRTPIRLSWQLEDACPMDSTCATTVTVASYSRSCTKEYISSEDIPLLHKLSFAIDCKTVGAWNSETPQDGLCALLQMGFQLTLSPHTHDPRKISSEPRGPWLDQIPPMNPEHEYSALQYTSYVKEATGSGELALRRCNFTSAYVDIPIEITNGTVVSMLKLEGEDLFRRNRGVELIPALALVPSGGKGEFMTTGILFTMRDLYEGYAVFDSKERQQLSGGIASRQYVNLSTIEGDIRGGYDFAFEDPLEAFTETLHELSLRYAMEEMVSTPYRTEELGKLFTTDVTGGSNKEPDPRPVMEVALRKLKTQPSPMQRVHVLQTRQVAVFKANTVYAVVAVGISLTATVLISLLFGGWRRLGRRFSASPLEVAKAFDAPLLRRAGSNIPGGEISKYHGDVKVRYGEVVEEELEAADETELEVEEESAVEMVAEREAETLAGADSSEEQVVPASPQQTAAAGDTDLHAGVDAGGRNSTDQDVEAAEGAESKGLMAAAGPRLTIDLVERVLKPVRGRAYL